MSFGIPYTNLCVDQDGILKEDFVSNYIETRKRIEAATAQAEEAKRQLQGNATNIVEVATDNDCLLGRGRPFQSHPGNIRLSRVIEEHQAEFDNASKFEKTIITWRIVTLMKDQLNARFLERDDGGAGGDNNGGAGAVGSGSGAWRVCIDEAARAKIAYGFRSGHKSQARRSKGGGADGDMTITSKRRKVG